MPAKLKDLTGHVFGRLVVVGRHGTTFRPVKWSCRCDCGTMTIVASSNLKTGSTRSCGCLQEGRPPVHGHASGGVRSSEYRTWDAMRQRCLNPNSKDFPRWGGRGITICERWDSFENFIADMGPRPASKRQIDRIDNAGNYEPGNCRWVTRKEQMRNTRDNRLLTHAGETLCLAEWCERLGLARTTAKWRLARGWSDHEVLFGR